MRTLILEFSVAKKHCNAMMRRREGFDTALGVTRLFMRIHGIWPGYCNSDVKIVRYTYLLPGFMIFFFINVPQTVQMFHVNGNFNAILNLLTMTDVPIAIAFVKVICVGFNNKVLDKLIISIAEDWDTTTKESELTTMWLIAKISRLISIVSISLGECTAIAFTAFMFFIMYTAFSSHEDDNFFKPLYMHGSFPYDTQISPNYEMTWFLQIIASFLSSGTFSSVDALFITLVLHLCGQLKNLQAAFRELGEIEDVEAKTFVKTLAALTERHQRINHFAGTIEYSFNMMFLFQVCSSTVLLCLQGYSFVIILTEGSIVLMEVIFMLYYTVWFVFSIFVYCYVVEVLQDEVDKLGQAIIYCNWYKLPAKEARLLIIPLVRINKPLNITAGKLFVFSLNLFSSIIKSAAGYMSMLLAVRDNLKQIS